jgi:uncharacterized membrane protein
MTRYLASCGLLTVPILVWNAVFTRYLPPALASSDFNRDIAPLLLFTENTLRLAVMVVPFLMPLDVVNAVQRRGLWLFVVGALLYVVTWVPLMVAPESAWSTSRVGFLAPAYTPLVWLAGLGLTGGRLYGSLPFKPWMYLLLAGAFVAVHVAHANLAYTRTYATRP